MLSIDPLVKGAVMGDRQALLSLCRAIAKGILFRVKYLLPNEQDAEDVAQEVLIRVCENIAGLKDPAAFRAWLSSIVVHEANRQLRKNVKRADVLYLDDYIENKVEENEEFLPHEHSMREEEYRLVMDIIRSLPGRQREAIMLYYYEDLTVVEAASVMHIPQPNVSLHLKLAREKIKKELLKRADRAGDGRMRAIAAFPLAPLLGKTLNWEAQRVSAGYGAWAQRAVESCSNHVGAGAGKVAVASAKTAAKAGAHAAAASHGTFASIAVAAVAVPVVMIALAVNGVFGQFYTGEKGQADGSIVFSGSDTAYRHLNPARAEADTTGGAQARGSWVITDVDGGQTLYSGDGTVVEQPFSQLPDGEYILTFTLEDEMGNTSTLYNSFQVLYEPGG